jgi:hypothetical protein
LIASTGHSGSQTPQSMHSSGWMTMFSPRRLYHIASGRSGKPSNRRLGRALIYSI